MCTKPLLCGDQISPEGSYYIGYYFMLSNKVFISCYKVIPILCTCVCSGRYRSTYGNPLQLYTNIPFRCLLVSCDIVIVSPNPGCVCAWGEWWTEKGRKWKESCWKQFELEMMVFIIQKDTCTPVFIAALFTIARSWKQPKCPSTDKWIKKMWYIYTMECYSAIKRNETGSFVETWMDLETVIQSEVRKRKTDIVY